VLRDRLLEQVARVRSSTRIMECLQTKLDIEVANNGLRGYALRPCFFSRSVLLYSNPHSVARRHKVSVKTKKCIIIIPKMFRKLLTFQECLDPRDSVFALLSLSTDLASVLPDYSLCTAEVFTLATRSISSDRSLLVLLQTCRVQPSSWSSFERKALPS
jgi:hypothetical protein